MNRNQTTYKRNEKKRWKRRRHCSYTYTTISSRVSQSRRYAPALFNFLSLVLVLLLLLCLLLYLDRCQVGTSTHLPSAIEIPYYKTDEGTQSLIPEYTHWKTPLNRAGFSVKGADIISLSLVTRASRETTMTTYRDGCLHSRDASTKWNEILMNHLH